MHNKKNNKRPVIIGVSGGSGSGKTTVSKNIINRLKGESVIMMTQDSYYKDQTEKTFKERIETNYDHPDAFDNELLIKQINDLLDGKSIEQPTYDYSKYNRSDKTIKLDSADVIIIEGVMLFTNEKLRKLLDIKIYVDTADDLRFIRRLQRDIAERGRSIDNIISQYLKTVKPMYNKFIEPSKHYADIILPEGGKNIVGINMIEAQIKDILM